MDQDVFFITLKTLLFLFILSSPFYNVHDVFYFLNNLPAKILLLALIVVSSFIDLQLAIIMAISFFILLMSFNHNVSQGMQLPSVKNVRYTRSIIPITPSPYKKASQCNMSASYDLNDIQEKDTNINMCISNRLDGSVDDAYKIYPGHTMQYNVNEMQAKDNGFIPPPHGYLDTTLASIQKYDTLPDIDTSKAMHTMYEFPDVQCNTPKEANNEYMNNAQVNYTLDERIKPYEDFISQITDMSALDSLSNAALV